MAVRVRVESSRGYKRRLYRAIAADRTPSSRASGRVARGRVPRVCSYGSSRSS